MATRTALTFVQDGGAIVVTVDDVRVLLQPSVPVCIGILCAVRVPQAAVLGSKLLASEILFGVCVSVGDHCERVWGGNVRRGEVGIGRKTKGMKVIYCLVFEWVDPRRIESYDALLLSFRRVRELIPQTWLGQQE